MKEVTFPLLSGDVLPRSSRFGQRLRFCTNTRGNGQRPTIPPLGLEPPSPADPLEGTDLPEGGYPPEGPYQKPRPDEEPVPKDKRKCHWPRPPEKVLVPRKFKDKTGGYSKAQWEESFLMAWTRMLVVSHSITRYLDFINGLVPNQRAKRWNSPGFPVEKGALSYWFGPYSQTALYQVRKHYNRAFNATAIVTNDWSNYTNFPKPSSVSVR